MRWIAARYGCSLGDVSVLVSVNALCAWWLLALGWLSIRGILRRVDAAADRALLEEGPEDAQRASIVPRHDGEPQRQA